MPNNYFQFKQFTIFQDACAQKVSTDSCLLGAFTAATILKQPIQPGSILDIGTGTGLLMLMLAQKLTASIDGIEVEPQAFRQAQQNTLACPWKDRLQVYHKNVVLYSPEKNYDFIISNPPFFEGSLKSANPIKNLAKHDDALTLSALLKAANRILSKEGEMSLLLPYDRLQELVLLAPAHQLFVTQQVWIRSKEKTPYFRCIFLLGRNRAPITTLYLTIKENNELYTTDFINLLKAYYLYL